MKRKAIDLFALTLLALSSLLGCQREPEEWTPVLEETSTVFLETEAERLLEHVRTARGALGEESGEAERALSKAEASLEHLTGYYLPLFQARERAYNAYRSLHLNDHARVREELGKIEEVLETMAEGAQGGRLLELQSLGRVLASARIAVDAGTEEGIPALETLARSLNQAALKGDMVLRR